MIVKATLSSFARDVGTREVIKGSVSTGHFSMVAEFSRDDELEEFFPAKLVDHDCNKVFDIRILRKTYPNIIWSRISYEAENKNIVSYVVQRDLPHIPRRWGTSL